MQTVIEKKVFLIKTLSADASFILQYVQQEKIITTRDYNKLNQSNDPQEEIVISLLDMVINKGEVMCCKFVDLLRQQDIQENFPELQQLFIPAPTSHNQGNPVNADNELKDNLAELENFLSKYNEELVYKVQKIKNTRGTREHECIAMPAQEESISLSVPHQEESISLPVPHQEESISLPVPHQEESISLPVPHHEESISLSVPHHEESISLSVPHHEESISLPNLSIGETHPRSGSLSENVVDTDAQREPASEIVPTNAINAEDYYPVTQRPLGYCVIINNYNFEQKSTLNNRKGTDADRDALTEVFRRMHFLIIERRDLSGSDMLNTVKEFSWMDHFKMGAFVCCILSHGEKGTVLGIDGEPVQIRDLTQPFALCSALTGKPKLFFIQACQGNELQKGMCRQDGIEEDGNEKDGKEVELSCVPLEADFLIGMATVESYKSFRHTITGSIYIQELCKQLKIGCPRNEDILSILTKVNRSVSAKNLNSHKQVPEPRYTLTKKLVLPMD